MHPRNYRLVFPNPANSPGSSAPTVLRVRPAPPPKGPGPGDQAALAFEPRELWVAVHVPQLPLLALRAPESSAPLAVLDPEDRNQRIIAVDDLALAVGVQAGMTLGAALAAAPLIDARPRDAAGELELLQRLAAIAAGFTPLVSIEAPDALLLEIKPSLRLFGGLRELCRRLRAQSLADPVLASVRAAPHFTLAPTALAALAAARAGARCFITDPMILPARLKPLPLTVLRWPEEENARLAAMGVRTLGELMRLPRAGFARRFGPRQLADLDRLLGRRADPRRRLVRRERYRGSIDLDHEIEDHERLLEALAPLLDELERFLRERQRGVTALRCRFRHYRAAPTTCVLRLAQAEGNARRLESLLRERLATLTLPEPVRRCEIESGALRERALGSRALWSAGERGHAPTGETPALIELLRARLGPEAVYGLKRHPEHRPENAWRVIDPLPGGSRAAADAAVLTTSRATACFRRPLWLLPAPQELDVHDGRPRRGGPLEVLTGPERLESGWWDGADIQRDYYTARDTRGSRLWIYRDHESGRWFLHGIFG